MIKLTKIKKPNILEKNAKKWTKEYCECLAKGITPNPQISRRYNNPEIKQALQKETYGKCAYCESKIKHISYGDIEHILPKNENSRPDLYVDWNNLTLSCEQCNRSGKGTYYDPQLPLVNPYIDNPSEYFLDLGALVMAIPNNDRAIITEYTLKLNRISLVERRMEHIKNIELLLRQWSKEKNQTIKNMLTEELHKEYSADKEFSSTIKSYLKENGFPVKDIL